MLKKIDETTIVMDTRKVIVGYNDVRSRQAKNILTKLGFRFDAKSGNVIISTIPDGWSIVEKNDHIMICDACGNVRINVMNDDEIPYFVCRYEVVYNITDESSIVLIRDNKRGKEKTFGTLKLKYSSTSNMYNDARNTISNMYDDARNTLKNRFPKAENPLAYW